MIIKVIHVASSHLLGLANQETQLSRAYNCLAGIDVLLLSGECEQYAGCFEILKRDGISNKIIKGFDVHHDFVRLVKEFLKVVNEFEPVIVTVNTNWQLVIAGVVNVCCKKKYKLIYTVHGFRHNDLIKSIIARLLISLLLFVFVDLINCPTVYVRKKYSALNRRIISIPLGVDDIFFSNNSDPDFSKPLNFLFAGVFRLGKNQAMLISAFAEYLHLSKDSESMLYLPGEGELRLNAIKIAEDLGVVNRVKFPGQLNRQEMLAMYEQCQVAIIPSNSETFGHCIAEPLVLSRIVISRNIGLAPDYIVDGKNGFLFEEKKQLVRCLLKVHSMSNDDLLKIAQSAGVTGKNFQWDNIASRHLKELFEPLLVKC